MRIAHLGDSIQLQNEHSKASNEQEIGRIHTVLVEGTSKKSDQELFGRTDTNKGVVFDHEDYEKGDYVKVRIEDCTSSTLLGTPLAKTTLAEADRTDSIATEPVAA